MDDLVDDVDEGGLMGCEDDLVDDLVGCESVGGFVDDMMGWDDTDDLVDTVSGLMGCEDEGELVNDVDGFVVVRMTTEPLIHLKTCLKEWWLEQIAIPCS